MPSTIEHPHCAVTRLLQKDDKGYGCQHAIKELSPVGLRASVSFAGKHATMAQTNTPSRLARFPVVHLMTRTTFRRALTALSVSTLALSALAGESDAEPIITDNAFAKSNLSLQETAEH